MNSFQEAQLEVVIGLDEMGATEKGTPENQIALEALVEVLQDALGENQLRNVCSSLVSLANSGYTVNTNGFLNGGKVIFIKDIAMLRVGLKGLINRISEAEQGEVKKSISIARPDIVSLFTKAIHGGKYFYWDTSGEIKVQKVKYFQGIPQEKWPTREKDGEQKPDFRINPETAKHIYQTLVTLEEPHNDNPAEKLSIKERVRQQREKRNRRKGEAKFFLEHLSPRFQEEIKGGKSS